MWTRVVYAHVGTTPDPEYPTGDRPVTSVWRYDLADRSLEQIPPPEGTA